MMMTQEKKPHKRMRVGWSKEEDQLIMKLHDQYIEFKNKDLWSMIASHFKGRTKQQCSDRYGLQLKPRSVQKWQLQEDLRLLQLAEQHGTKWATIANEMTGRTRNQVKNRYNSNLCSEEKIFKMVSRYHSDG